MSDKAGIDSYLDEMDQKFSDIADAIPVDRWGFEPETLEFLRKTRHRAVAKAAPVSVLKGMSKKEKARLGRLLGPCCDTSTQILDWIRSTHLASIGVPKNVRSVMAKKSDNNEENGDEPTMEEKENVKAAETKAGKNSKVHEREQKIAAILKAKGIGKRNVQQMKMNKIAKKKTISGNPTAKKEKKVHQMKIQNMKKSKKGNKTKKPTKKKATT